MFTMKCSIVQFVKANHVLMIVEELTNKLEMPWLGSKLEWRPDTFRTLRFFVCNSISVTDRSYKGQGNSLYRYYDGLCLYSYYDGVCNHITTLLIATT